MRYFVNGKRTSKKVAKEQIGEEKMEHLVEEATKAFRTARDNLIDWNFNVKTIDVTLPIDEENQMMVRFDAKE